MTKLGMGFSGILHDPCHHNILSSDCVGCVVMFHELKFCLCQELAKPSILVITTTNLSFKPVLWTFCCLMKYELCQLIHCYDALMN